jgi:hypothetical protein
MKLLQSAWVTSTVNKITNIYLDNFDQSLIDEVNERIIKLIE